MNKALSEMLNCLNTMGNLTRNDTDMSVLERQQARMKWQQELSYFNGNEFNVFPIPSQAPQFEDLGLNNSHDSGGLNEFVNRVVKADPGLENGWHDFGKLGGSGSGFGSCVLGNGSELNYTLPRTTSCPPGMPGSDIRVAESPLPEKLTSAVGRDSFKKRKHDKSQNLKAVLEDDTKEKRLKGCGEEEESKITEQNSNNDKKPNNKNNNNSNRETSADTSKDNSKVSEVRKPDYIHVRARRGQATDSHSLAERVRRERISERMKYLQDLVPGCNKITGKAGMLDEIINYVQSLQRQVEFLSMKLAAVNPSLDFNIDNFFTKEVFPACTSNFPTIGVSSEMANQPYLQFNSLQQIVSCSELEMGINPADTTLRRTISAPISIPETFLDTSCFNQIHPSSAWEADLQNLYAMEFHQGRSTSFPCQQFSGSIEASSLKMEM